MSRRGVGGWRFTEFSVGAFCGDFLWGLSVGTFCGDFLWGLSVGAFCGDFLWGLSVGTFWGSEGLIGRVGSSPP
jgi:hypothetical protein